MSRAAIVAGVLLITGTALIVGGTYILAGPGWAMLAAAVPFMALGAVIARGLNVGS